jgi:hypothetical protein
MRKQPPATFAVQPPQVQLLLHTRWPQESPLLQEVVCPGVHAALTPLHADQAPHACQVQDEALHVRVRVCLPVPHAPQAWLPVSTCPVLHSPSAMQALQGPVA